MSAPVRVNPIGLELSKNALLSIADGMALTTLLLDGGAPAERLRRFAPIAAAG